MSDITIGSSDMNSSNKELTSDKGSDDEQKKSKRKDTPTYTHIPARTKMLGQGQGREGTISFSVEEVDEYAEENEEPEQDCEASASKIKVIETSFDTPRKSSFRVKKGIRREVSVHYSETPDIVGNEKEDTDVTETEDQNKIYENDKLSEKDFEKLNFGLRSKLRRD